jgi:hypothetical protein
MINIVTKIADESNLIRNEIWEEFEIPDIDTLTISPATINNEKTF